MTAVEVFAPAKLNLHLHVGPLRADARHPLQSLAVFADVGDRLTIEPADDLQLHIDGPFSQPLSSEPDNLVLRAARALAEHVGRKANAHIRLEKRLPIASGIGGGSADAAAALRGLAHLWDLHLAPGTLERIAAGLGADVPVCVASRSAFMAGAGEQTTPVATPATHAVLVNPGVPLSTGAVYRRFDEMGLGGEFVEEPPPGPLSDLLEFALARRNDLEPPACALSPAVAETMAWLGGAPETKLARMSGSGASCFALTEDALSAEALALRTAAEHPAWWVVAVRLGAVDSAPRPL